MSSLDADTETPLYGGVGGTSLQHHTVTSGGRAGSQVVPLGPEERVCVEALRGLSALLPQLPAETVLPHTPLLLIRARLFAEKVIFVFHFQLLS